GPAAAISEKDCSRILRNPSIAPVQRGIQAGASSPIAGNCRQPETTPSAQPGDVGRNSPLIGCEFLAELRREQGIFDTYTDFGANHEHCQRRQEQWPRCEDEPGA